MLREIDEAILNRFERFSHWTQRAFGWSSGHWIKVVCVLLVAGYGYDLTVRFSALKVLPVLVILILWSLVYLEGDRRAKEEVAAESIPRNSMAADGVMRAVRFGLLLLGIMFPPINVFYLMNLCPPCALYFLAVTDLPQSPSRLRQWLDSFGDAGQPAEAMR